MAHGLPGVIAALRLVDTRVSHSRIRQTLVAAQARLEAVTTAFDSASFPSYIVDGHPVTSKHAAWCYGVLPAVWTRLSMGEHSGDQSQLNEWETLGSWHPWVAQHGRMGLCHGAAGVGYLLALLARKLGSEALWDNAIHAMRAALGHTAATSRGLLAGPLGALSCVLALADGPRENGLSEILGLA
jgi:hypothetical protein